MFLKKMKNNWRVIIGITITTVVFLVSSLALLYWTKELSFTISSKINLYWWLELFENKKLTYLQFILYSNSIFILYTLNYISLLIAILWGSFEKNKTILSLFLFSFFVIFGLSVNNMFMSTSGKEDFQIVFSILQKYSLLSIFGIYLFQVLSKYYNKKIIEI